MLGKNEELHLKYCHIDGKIVEMLAQCCRKLKFLNVFDCTTASIDIDLLFLQHYSALERFRYWPSDSVSEVRIDQLKVFLEKHAELKYFESRDEV